LSEPLLGPSRTELAPVEYLRSRGSFFAEFGALTQDSGNVSYGVEVEGRRYFVKTAGRPEAAGSLPHDGRVALLRNAVEVARSLDHPALVPLRAVIESPHGPLLVYDWVDGELLGVDRARREDPATAHQRFRALPPRQIVAALDAVYDLHAQLAGVGWVAADFYDGALVYDFERRRIHAVDLDNYHRGPFTNAMGRMFGSTRFMSPEEFQLGATIDERTTVFNLGRTAAVFLSDGTLERAPFRGVDAQHAVVVAACSPEPRDRCPSVAAFVSDWTAAGE
jgi:serine/threonine-protein kinase